MRSKWQTFLMSFGVTFGATLVLFLGVSYLGIYRPRLVECRTAMAAEDAAQQGAEGAVGASNEPDGPPAAADEPAEPGSDPEAAARPAKTEGRKAVSGSRPPKGGSKGGKKLSPASGARQPANGAAPAKESRGKSTRTFKGVFLSAEDGKTLELLRKALAEVVPTGKAAGIKSATVAKGVVTVRMTDPTDPERAADPATVAGKLAGILSEEEFPAGKIEIIEAGEVIITEAF